MNLRKHTGIFAMAGENLRINKLKTISLFIPLFLAMGIYGAMNFAGQGFLRDAQMSLSLLPDIIVQNLSGGRMGMISLTCRQKISKIEGVKLAVLRAWGYLPLTLYTRGLERGEDVVYTFMGIDIARMPIAPEIGLSLTAGRFLRKGDRGKIVVGKGFSRPFAAHVGDRFTLKNPWGRKDEFEIIGIFSTEVAIYTAGLILATKDDVSSFFGYGREYATDLCVFLDRPGSASRVALKISQEMPNLRALTRDSLSAINEQVFGRKSGIFQILWMILLFTALLIACAQASNITTDLKKEMGILRALGWGVLEIIELKSWESLIIGLIATLLGMVAALGYLLFGAPGIKNYFLGWSHIYPEFSVPFQVDFSTVMLMLVIGIFPLLTATIFPCWIMGTIEPDEAIRI